VEIGSLQTGCWKRTETCWWRMQRGEKTAYCIPRRASSLLWCSEYWKKILHIRLWWGNIYISERNWM